MTDGFNKLPQIRPEVAFDFDTPEGLRQIDRILNDGIEAGNAANPYDFPYYSQEEKDAINSKLGRLRILETEMTQRFGEPFQQTLVALQEIEEPESNLDEVYADAMSTAVRDFLLPRK